MLYGRAVLDLDRNATTPLAPEVRDAMVAVWEEPGGGGNPSSVHGLGRRARARVEAARRELAAAVGARPLDVVWTSGGTEANALAILGASRDLAARGAPHAVAASPIAHPSALRAAEAASPGGRAPRLPVGRGGRLDPEAVASAVAAWPEVGVVSFTAAHHELGTVQDVPALVAALRSIRPDLVVHCDAVAAFGKVPVDVATWGADLVTLSAHKISGPKGVGAVVMGPCARVAPLWSGGGQERGIRPGTEPVALIHGFGCAASLARAGQAAHRAHTAALRARLVAGLEKLPGVTIHGHPEHQSGNTALLAAEGCEGELLVMALDLEGIAVSAGAACSSGTNAPLASLLALGHPPAVARSAVRVSLGPDHTEADVDRFLRTFAQVLPRVRAAGEGAA